LCVLPGSRRGEVARLLPVFAETVAQLAASRPDLQVLLPTVDGVADQVRAAVAGWPVPVTVLDGGVAQKAAAYAASNAALAASGTVSLELALAGVPMLIAYHVNHVTAAILRRMLRVDSVTLVNLILGQKVIPEFLQEACRPDRLAPALDALLCGGAAADRQATACATAVKALHPPDGGSPSAVAAQVIVRLAAGQPA